jgi:putative ABC transport system substrate-binding protein
MPVIGFLSGTSPAPYEAYVAAFREGLSEADYVDGQTVMIEYRWAEGLFDRLPALAADLVNRKVDVIAASGGPLSALAAKNSTSAIPIVFITGGDPIGQGLVTNLARPSSNLTGVSFLVDELMPKRFELLLELVPQAKAVALLVNPKSPNAERMMREIEKATRARGLQLRILKASTEGEIETAFGSLDQKQVDALLAGSDAFFNSQRNLLVALASRRAIPAIYDTREYAEAGGLMTYGVSVAAIYRQLGVYTGKILKGAKPADLPVQQPTKFELVVNLKTAQAFGLTVPQSLLARADEVIE